MIIPIVMATDKNYVLQTRVTMESIMVNERKNNEIHFIILYSQDLDDDKRTELEFIAQKNKNCLVRLLCVNDFFDNTKTTVENVDTKATFYRLGIPSYLSRYKKCIYLDSDTIVERDISSLMMDDISDYYIAGVVSYGVLNIDRDNLEKIIEYENVNEYINAGVLLLNLEKIREDRIEERFYSEMVHPYPCQDQDIINKVCAGHIKHLEYKFNAMTKYYDWDEDSYCGLATREEIREARENPVIIHYADVMKPWKNPYCACAKNWWKYFWKIDNAQEKFELLRLGMEQEHEKLCSKHAQEIVNLNNSYWKLLNRTLSFYDKLYIYGAGVYGKKLCSILSKKGIQIEGFIVSDNEPLNENTQNIIGFVERKESNYLILVAVSDRYLNVILDSLEKHNIDNYITLGKNEINSLDIDC